MTHVQDKNQLRQKVPGAFRSNAYDSTLEFEQLIQQSFKPVAIPTDIKRQAEIDKFLGRKKPSAAIADALQDEKYVRRLKMANYGRWFIKPSDYTNKVNKLNQELN